MGLDRLGNGERISGCSAILLFVFMFFSWYGLGISEQPNLRSMSCVKKLECQRLSWLGQSGNSRRASAGSLRLM
jgi:hypothetical protein